MSGLPTFGDIEKAHLRLMGDVVRTPLLRSDLLDQIAKRKVWVKAECLQYTGSFKYRGARYRILSMTDEQCQNGVVAYSSGNHAQGVALAASKRGVECLIVMPSDTPKVKVEGVRRLGGEVRFYDRLHENREQIAAAIAADTGAVLIPPFDDFHVICGQGSVGMEVAEQFAEKNESLQAVVINAGGGGLTAGVGLALEYLPALKIYTAEPNEFDDHRRSFISGIRQKNAKLSGSICDALMAEQPGHMTFEINKNKVTAGLAVTDEQVLSAMKFAFTHLKIVLEPGGAASLAAALNGLIPGTGSVCVIATGGNVDPVLFTQAIADPC
ncbi:MAG: threonine/serine dehydratase [Robiginitomaculum sp.]|nr:threonine/serine dehydratase [Robiginitomaculum sp.]